MSSPSPPQPPHPMVPVPDAIRAVLHETARILLSRGQAEEEEQFAVGSVDLSKLIGRTLSRDVLQRSPGYPPYRASVMDGYAIRTLATEAAPQPEAASSTAEVKETTKTAAPEATTEELEPISNPTDNNIPVTSSPVTDSAALDDPITATCTTNDSEIMDSRSMESDIMSSRTVEENDEQVVTSSRTMESDVMASRSMENSETTVASFMPESASTAKTELWTHRVVDKVMAGDPLIPTIPALESSKPLSLREIMARGGPARIVNSHSRRGENERDMLDNIFETAESLMCGGGAESMFEAASNQFDKFCGKTGWMVCGADSVAGAGVRCGPEMMMFQGADAFGNGENYDQLSLAEDGEPLPKHNSTTSLETNAAADIQPQSPVIPTTTADGETKHDLVAAGDEKGDKINSALSVAHYVATGAIVPDAYDRVVPVEECKVSPNGMYIAVVVDETSNPWIRPPGCDVAPGSVVLPKGHVLDAVSLGLLLQSGVTHVSVRRPVTVGVLSTGNELQAQQQQQPHDSWEDLSHGTIPDVNRPILLSLLSSWGYCNVIDLGIARDTSKAQLANKLTVACRDCEVIVTTGGISMGESDIVEEVLVNHLNGRLHFGRLHMKPGKPTTLFTVPTETTERLIFCLPGNPVSATVCAQLLVRPCLHMWFRGLDTASIDNQTGSIQEEHLRRAVATAWVPSELQGSLSHDIKLDMERPEYHRVTLDRAGSSDTTYTVKSTGAQQSSRLMSLRDAQGLLVLPKGTKDKPMALRGESYTVIWLGKEDDNSLWLPRVQVQTSLHLAKPRKAFTMGIVLLVDGKSDCVNGSMDELLNDLSKKIPDALSGSFSTVSSRVHTGPVDDTMYNLMSQLGVDLVVVVTPRSTSFAYHTQAANWLRTRLVKVADSLAIQLRRGAAFQDPQAAMYENLVGFLPASVSMAVLLPERGLEGALGNVRGLLKHSLQIAQGEAH